MNVTRRNIQTICCTSEHALFTPVYTSAIYYHFVWFPCYFIVSYFVTEDMQ